jgi:glycosyltransferase involved in cell wall biosynthesis
MAMPARAPLTSPTGSIQYQRIPEFVAGDYAPFTLCATRCVDHWRRIETQVDGLGGISVVVPVYNSGATLSPLVKRLRAVLEPLPCPHEIILVNDGSRDDSWRQIEALALAEPAVRGIDLMRNYGQHNALLCGVREARYAVTVTLDDDLQNPPEAIPILLAKLNEGVDVVYGTPEVKSHGLFRNGASWLTRLVLRKTLGVSGAMDLSSYRAFRTRVREAFSDYRSPSVSLDVLLTWGSDRFAAVNVPHHPRAEGSSNYTLRKLVSHAFAMVTGFSLLPLQVATYVGFAFTFVGIGVFLLVLLNYLIRGATVPGFTFLASIIAIFSGVQLFALGVFGEYLARIHFRTMERPVYRIRERLAEGCDERDA